MSSCVLNTNREIVVQKLGDLPKTKLDPLLKVMDGTKLELVSRSEVLAFQFNTPEDGVVSFNGYNVYPIDNMIYVMKVK